jgi:pimeloyl-ACP methyl ester carboxylesterase
VLDDIARHSRSGPAWRFAETALEMISYLLDGRLDEVAVPVDLVWGDGDDLLTIDYAERLRDGLPAARLRTVRGCGHVPHRECPLRLLEQLTAALAEPPPIAAEPAAAAEPET